MLQRYEESIPYYNKVVKLNKLNLKANFNKGLKFSLLSRIFS